MNILICSSSTMTTIVKPKERQFQVVPVPAIFTRGRWECRDYKESSNFAVLSTAESNSNSKVQTLDDNLQTQNSNVPVKNLVPKNSETNVEVTTSNNETNLVASNNVNVLPKSAAENESSSSKENSTTINTNSVAIDNKIEQAMDLVKNHLTIAVREEMELLRIRIYDLESRVNNLESENQILRQFAPIDIVANLPVLVKNSQQQQHKAQVSTDTDNSTSVQISQTTQLLHQNNQQQQQVNAQSTVNLATTTSSFAFVSSQQSSTNTISQQYQQQNNIFIPNTSIQQQQQQHQIQSISLKTVSPTSITTNYTGT